MTTPAPLTGLAIGDALGMPFESIPSTFDKVGLRLAAWDGKSYGRSDYHKLGPGQWTDDTQMTLALATSILDNGGYFPEKAAQNYLAWYQSGDCRGMGSNTRQAMENLRQGVAWNQSGTPGALGNGTAMRAAPLGLIRGQSVSDLVRNTHNDAIITHQSEPAQDGSLAVALSVHHLSKGGAKNFLLALLIGTLPNGVLRERVQLLAENLNRPETIPSIFEWERGAVGHVLQTVPAALFAFMTTDNFLDAVVTAIRLGGDADTTAAITGAFAGSYYGDAGIPEQYIAQLERAGDIRTMELALMDTMPTV